jgi:hypothetical protein
MKTIIDIANGAVTELVLKDVPEDPHPVHSRKHDVFPSHPRIGATGNDLWRLGRPYACRISQSLQVRFYTRGRLFTYGMGIALESKIGRTNRV